VRPDAGRVEIAGRAVEIRGPRHALELGIGLVHQDFMGVPALTVGENLILGDAGPPWLSRDAVNARAQATLREHGLELDPGLPAARLSVGEKQRLEIARALSRGVSLLILDEPTAVLAPSEVEELLALLARLRNEGRSIVLISHKLEEITQACDRVSVLRAGETVATRDVAGASAAELGRWMVGEEPPPAGAPIDSAPGEPALELRGLRAAGLDAVDLEVRAGEVYALAGIDGNGQAPLEEVLAGVRPIEGGRLELRKPPLSLLSGDRQRTGLVLDLSLAENLVLEEAARDPRPPVFQSGLLRPNVLRAQADAAIRRFGVHAQPGSAMRALSGGNQQKLCVARALRRDPGVLVAVNPTRGLDLSATAAVRDEIRARARAGTAVLLISTDLDEVLELGNRVGVLFRGRVLPVERSRAQIGQRMLGVEGA
jgi:simple sugar transport system ATP-binding protein